MATQEAQQLKQQGNKAFSAGDNHEAIKCFSRAIELDPNDHVFYSNRSAAYAALGQYGDALQDAEACVRIAPQWAKGYSRLGLALFNLSRLEEAKKAYDQGLALEPNNASMLEGLQQIESATANPFGQIFGPDIWVKIQTNPRLAPFLKDPNFVANVQKLQANPSLISTMLTDPKIQALFGVLLGMGSEAPGFDDMEREETREEPEPVPEKAPEPKQPEPELSPEARLALEEKEKGNAAYKKRDFDTAMAAYERAVQADPNNLVLLLNIAAVHIETGRYDEAVQQCEKCVEMCSQQGGQLQVAAKAYGRMGTAYLKSGDLVKAISSYEKSLVEHHDRLIEKKLKEAKKLKEEADKNAYLDDDKALEHKEKGNKLFQEGQWAPAIAEYSESILRNPKDHRTYSNRAACYTKLMDWSNALNDVNKAIELDPTFIKAYIRKGVIETFLKQYHKAKETYYEGLKIDPNCEDLLNGLRDVENAIANENLSGDIDPERQARAMADPEVQKILADPQVNNVLMQIQNDPSMAQKAFNDPVIRKKLDVLISAGVLRVK